MKKQIALAVLIGIAVGGAATLVWQNGLPRSSFTVIALSESEQTLSGLTAGADVHVLGVLAGQVQKMTPLVDHRVELTVRIRKKFADFVKQDSTLVVKRKFGIAGTPYLELTVGKAEPLAPGSTAQLRVVRAQDLDQHTREAVHAIATMIADATITNKQEVAGEQNQ